MSCYFIALLIGSTCFEHYYAHRQGLATVMFITRLVVSFLVCCMLEVRWHYSSLTAPNHTETRTHGQCGDSIEKPQAPDDGCINVRNVLSIEEVK